MKHPDQYEAACKVRRLALGGIPLSGAESRSSRSLTMVGQANRFMLKRWARLKWQRFLPATLTGGGI
jgi:hypothetical protein